MSAHRTCNARFNRTGSRVDWAGYTWNPVTGCRHNCPYCYARDLAEGRFAHAFPNGFEPTFWEDRLAAPANEERMARRRRVPKGRRERICFVCSMADLFGEWVPQEWIDAVLAAERKAPSWTFAHLTKNPDRLADQDWPPNAWVGATVDRNEKLQPTLKALSKVQCTIKFISFEPLLERIEAFWMDFDAAGIDWVIIGAQSATSRVPEFQPKWGWVQEITDAAPYVFWKPNLKVRAEEWPDMDWTE